MLKNALIRGINSFMYAVSINVVASLIIMVIVGEPDFLPLVPEYAALFKSKAVALLLQNILIGITGSAFGAGSVLLEMERWSLLRQSVIYYIVTAAFWVPVSIFCWRADKYITACISMICSYTASYIITWIIQYRSCKKSVMEINQKLNEMKLE